MTSHVRASIALLPLLAAPVMIAAANPLQVPQPQVPTVSLSELKKSLGEPQTIKATVSAIDYDDRVVVLRDDSGKDHSLYVGSEVARFKNIKVGDRLTATYYMSLASRLLAPGEAGASGTVTGAVPTAGGDRPAGTFSEQTRWLVTVESVDVPNQTVALRGEQGRVINVRVADRERLAQVKPGDKLEVTLTAAVIVNMTPGSAP